MRSHRPLILFVATATIIVIAIAAAAGCHGRPEIDRRAGAAGHPITGHPIAAPGVVEPWQGEVALVGAEAGVIVELRAAEGQTVQRGALVARLDDDRQRHQLAVALAGLAEAEAALQGLASTRDEIRVAEAEQRAAQARAELQQREQRRALTLGERGAITGAEVERAGALAVVDTAGLDAATARLALTRRGVRPAERRLARARLDSAHARVAQARADLARREIRAPTDGTVVWSRRHPGERHEPLQGPLVVLGDLRRLQVRLEVDELDAAAVRAGAACELRGDGGEALGTGSVTRLAPGYGSRALPDERPTERGDGRVREVFVETKAAPALAPGQRVWGYCAR